MSGSTVGCQGRTDHATTACELGVSRCERREVRRSFNVCKVVEAHTGAWCISFKSPEFSIELRVKGAQLTRINLAVVDLMDRNWCCKVMASLPHAHIISKSILL